MYFKNFYKSKEKGFIDDEQKKINDADNKKMKVLLATNMSKGFRTMEGSHKRFLDISDYFLRHSVNKQDAAAQDYLDRVAVGIRMVVERIHNVDDFHKIAHMIDVYNSGALDDIFKKKEEVVSNDDKEVYGTYQSKRFKHRETGHVYFDSLGNGIYSSVNSQITYTLEEAEKSTELELVIDPEPKIEETAKKSEDENGN